VLRIEAVSFCFFQTKDLAESLTAFWSGNTQIIL